MKKYFIFLVLILFFYGCKDLSSPIAPVIPTPKANMILDGEMERCYTYFGCPQFKGIIKNIGNNTGYNVIITIICYSDFFKKIDTAQGQAVNLAVNFGDIIPGQKAFFATTAYNLSSHSQIKAYNYKITWLER